MLDLSTLYLVDMDNGSGEVETTACRIICYNTTTELYTISVAGQGTTFKVTEDKLTPAE